MNYWWIIYMDRQGINLTSASAVKRPLCHVIIIADWTDSQSSYELMRALDWEINGGFICSTVDVIQAKFLKYNNGQFGSCVPVISELLWDTICECDHICACMCVYSILEWAKLDCTYKLIMILICMYKLQYFITKNDWTLYCCHYHHVKHSIVKKNK